MGVGPVEYLVVGFPGNNFKGEIAPALAKLVDDKLVRILDLIFIGKDTDGTIVTFEVDEVDGDATSFSVIDGELGGLIGDDDINHAAAALEPGTSAALLIWEDVWATTFADAVRNADGIVLEGGRIPHEIIEAALTALPASRLTATTRTNTRRHHAIQETPNCTDGGRHRRRRRHRRSRREAHGEQRQPAGRGPAGCGGARRPAPAAEDPYEQLTKLGELHAQGILTDEEFAAQKAKLLA